MRILKPNVEIVPQADGLEGIYEIIERAGRNCYKSEPKGNAKEFVEKKLIAPGHTAMLEHGTVYLSIHKDDVTIIEFYKNNKYSFISEDETKNFVYITTNFRVIYDNNRYDDLRYAIPYATSRHIKRVTFKFTTQIAITREANRSRLHSMGEESTRYVNYHKDAHGSEISINQPHCVTDEMITNRIYNHLEGKELLIKMCDDVASYWDTDSFNAIDYWLFANLACEYSYMNLIRLGWRQEDARTILPLDTNTVLYHTATIPQWLYFLDLRHKGTTGRPHPDMVTVSTMVKKLLTDNKYVDDTL